MEGLIKKFKADELGVVLLIIIVLSVLVYVFFNLNNLKLVHENKYYASVEIGDIVGFDVNNSALMFGSILQKGSANRKIIFDNPHNFDLILKFVAEGEIGELFNNEDIIVSKGESKEIFLSVVALDGKDFGVYEGNISVLAYKFWIYGRK